MSLQDKLAVINQLNETKGQELAVLSQLPAFREQAETEHDWPMVAQSYWQEHLAHQHLVMNDQDPDDSHRTAMLTTAQSAHQVVIDHNLSELLGNSHRFLGRAYTYNGRHEEAKTEYQTAIDLLQKVQDPRYLEVSGFLAESLIRTGEVEKGLALAYEIFDKYDTDPLALTLQKADNYVYLVWRTGIFPRLQIALDDVQAVYDKAKLKSYLEKSQALLTDTDKFAYRLTEISKSLSLIVFLLAYYLPLITDLGHHPRL
ncbi:hypothetical protein HYV64_04945 [Candidatus Shapirobacteria bacterium]|nr:hypothetical protein [Candidatus Shapirobacteria bacterium]